MRPSSIDLIDGISWSLETYIVPDLGDPLAQSAARSIGNLLNHLRARIADEAQVLWEDSQEKRALFADVTELASRAGGGAAEALLEVTGATEAVASVSARAPGRTDDLLIENELLKDALSELIERLQAHRDELGGAYDTIDAKVREQLRRQLDRENRWVLEPLRGRRPF